MTTEIKIPERSSPEYFVNAEGFGGGASLRIEFLDEQERPLAGFSGRNAAVVRENGLRTRIDFASEWGDGRTPAAIRLRVFFDGEKSRTIRLSAVYIVL